MTELIRMPLDDQGRAFVLVERTAADGPRGPVRADGGMGTAVRKAGESLQAALSPIRDAARVVLDELREAGPDEIAVEFGVTLTSEAGAFIAKAGTECHLTVTLTWKGEGEDTPRPTGAVRQPGDP
jgi:hypothetical protein